MQKKKLEKQKLESQKKKIQDYHEKKKITEELLANANLVDFSDPSNRNLDLCADEEDDREFIEKEIALIEEARRQKPPAVV